MMQVWKSKIHQEKQTLDIVNSTSPVHQRVLEQLSKHPSPGRKTEIRIEESKRNPRVHFSFFDFSSHLPLRQDHHCRGSREFLEPSWIFHLLVPLLRVIGETLKILLFFSSCFEKILRANKEERKILSYFHFQFFISKPTPDLL